MPESGQRARSGRSLRAFATDTGGAVAAMYGMSLFALVGVAGVAFDYARLAGMHSELQNAADQAALAGVTQLDGEPDACARASWAAVDLLSNETLLSNDGQGSGVTITDEPDCDAVGFIRFYADRDLTVPATSDANARFIHVFVNARTANYALTPVVGAFSSGAIDGSAAAGMGSAICNTPPVMICNPFEGTASPEFDPNDHIGAGVRLLGGGHSTPGNFGFLMTSDEAGAGSLAKALGWDHVPGNCSAMNGVTTEPGQMNVVFNALNTRFDLDTSGGNTCPEGPENCSAAPVVRKDLVRESSCGTSGNKGWQQSPNPYGVTSNRLLTAAEREAIDVMGLPRDTCHAWSLEGNCTHASGLVGDGQWDRDAYFKANFGWDRGTWTYNTGLDETATRWEVYQWEVAQAKDPAATWHNAVTQTEDLGTLDAHSTPVCRGTGNAERRKITAAIINCQEQNVKGRSYNVQVHKWMELFLVEPSIDRTYNGTKVTDDTDVYVEIIRAADLGSGSGGGDPASVVRRDVPFLIR